MVNAILLPVKDPLQAKERLADVLSPTERRDLVWAMLTDVSRALVSCRLADRIVVVAHDPEVISYAGEMYWEVFREETQISESHSVDRVSALLAEQGVRSVLRLPIDIPLVREQDLNILLSQASHAPSALLVPSRDGLGTNALLRSPPNVFPSRFGRNSLQRHLEEAQRVCLTPRIINIPRVALDLDYASDLREFHLAGQGTATGGVLQRVKFIEKLSDQNRNAHATS